MWVNQNMTRYKRNNHQIEYVMLQAHNTRNEHNLDIYLKFHSYDS